MFSSVHWLLCYLAVNTFCFPGGGRLSQTRNVPPLPPPPPSETIMRQAVRPSWRARPPPLEWATCKLIPKWCHSSLSLSVGNVLQGFVLAFCISNVNKIYFGYISLFSRFPEIIIVVLIMASLSSFKQGFDHLLQRPLPMTSFFTRHVKVR